MSSISIKGFPGVSSHTKREELQRSSEDLDREKLRLRKATNEFESLFIYEMLKTMRKTIPQDSHSLPAPFSKELGKDTFMQLFDMELARKMVNGRDGSISAMLYNSLEKVVEAQFHASGSDGDAKAPDSQTAEPIKLRKDDKSQPLLSPGSIPIERDTQELTPIDRRSRPRHTAR
ncbi:MAG: rod-binding protein [Candidatus Zixiibacteriota bacterium]